MIKLIASDLDGTLLDPAGKLPQSTFDVIAPIVENGVLFIPASGRQYESLRQMFPSLLHKSAFICENGALVKYMGATIHLDPIPEETARRILAAAKSLPDVHVIYCGEQTAFVESDHQDFLSRASVAYPCNRKVERLEDVVGIEPCCKIALFSTVSSRTQAYPGILPHLDDSVTATLSGGHWCDVMSKTANKGTAMRKVQALFKITPEECIAFGDHLNDLELLAACKTTYAPESAQPEVKAVVGEIIPSNADMGVLSTLKRLFNEGVFTK